MHCGVEVCVQANRNSATHVSCTAHLCEPRQKSHEKNAGLLPNLYEAIPEGPITQDFGNYLGLGQ